MAILSRRILKSFFETNDKPTQAQFGSLIDSMLHTSEDEARLGLHAYNPALAYVTGEVVLYNGELYEALTNTSGTFDPASWKKLLAIGAVTYRGTWDAAANMPPLASSQGIKGDYYMVSQSGSTELDGISGWLASDYAIFNGTTWERVAGLGHVQNTDTKLAEGTELELSAEEMKPIIGSIQQGPEGALAQFSSGIMFPSSLREESEGIRIAENKLFSGDDGKASLDIGTGWPYIYGQVDTGDSRTAPWFYIANDGGAYIGGNNAVIGILPESDVFLMADRAFLLKQDQACAIAPTILLKATGSSNAGGFSEGGPREATSGFNGEGTELFISMEEAIVKSASNSFAGLQYIRDFSANYTDRSLVDKAYVNSRLSGTDGRLVKFTSDASAPSPIVNSYLTEEPGKIVLDNDIYLSGQPVMGGESNMFEIARPKIDFGNADYGYLHASTMSGNYLYLDPQTGEADIAGTNGGIYIAHGVPVSEQYLQFRVNKVEMHTADMVFTGGKVEFQENPLSYMEEPTEGESFFGIDTRSGIQKIISTDPLASASVFFRPGMITLDSTGAIGTEAESRTALLLTSEEATIGSTSSTFGGLKYESDYSFNYTDRSLIDKGYLDTSLSSVNAAISLLDIASDTVQSAQTIDTIHQTIFHYTPSGNETTFITAFVMGRKNDLTSQVAYRMQAVVQSLEDGTVNIIDYKYETEIGNDLSYDARFSIIDSQIVIEAHGNASAAESVDWTVHAKIIKI
jgi:hypothetical protein